MIKTGEKIAVVGLSCIFPGAGDVTGFCDNILAGRSAVVEIPSHRWAVSPDRMFRRNGAPDTTLSTRAGLLDNIPFDPGRFDLPPGLLENLDPLHHLVLSSGHDLLSHCRCTGDLLENAGVILAAISLPTQSTTRISQQILLEHQSQNLTAIDAVAAGVVSLPATLLARALGLRGGAFTLDAACASSLYAIKMACDQLRSGRSDLMIAGGVSRPDILYTQVGFTQLQALSPTGRCAPFDHRADGLVVGEGVGLTALKRLSDALADDDHIYAVISGSGWSNDIGGTLVAPASDGQIRAMASAYTDAGWRPDDVQYIECHGSGTPVGDRVELTSMAALWHQYGLETGHLAIGSVKSNIGHLLTAAGAAGFIKTVMAMDAGILPPSLNFEHPPEDSPLRDGLFKVQEQPQPWHPEPLKGHSNGIAARRAGISAFGFGGINAHLLIESPDRCRPTAPAHGIRITVPPFSESAAAPPQNNDIAVIGMALLTPLARDINDLKQRLIGRNGQAMNPAPLFKAGKETGPAESVHPADTGAAHHFQPFKTETSGDMAWFETIDTFAGEFHLPPKQVPELLPQHLVMLKAARDAMTDAGISSRPGPEEPERSRFGAAIGIEFDFGATDFHLRWHEAAGSEHHDLQSHIPPLTAGRTLGALGGIVASRIAREFKLGGPCFTLSGGGMSGPAALETGIRALASGELDLFLCGGVDMAGDLRQHLLHQTLTPDPSRRKNQAPLNGKSNAIPSEGAAALILKPLARARKDGDRIHCVIRGVSRRSGAEMAAETVLKPHPDMPRLVREYRHSLSTLIKTSGLPARQVDLLLTNGPGNSRLHSIETTAARDVFGTALTTGKKPAETATTNILGTTGAAGCLVSIIHGAIELARLPNTRDDISPGREEDGDILTPGDPSTIDTDSHSFEKHQDPINIPMRYGIAGAFDLQGGCGHVLMAVLPHSGPGDSHLPNNPSRPDTSPTSPTSIRIPAHRFVFQPQPTAAPDQESVPVSSAARAHMAYLAFSRQNFNRYGDQFSTLTALAGLLLSSSETLDAFHPADPETPHASRLNPPLFDRDMCLEFAVGRAGRVMGPQFDIIDTYPVRVRLPDEPLMLVDRILSIKGAPCSLGPGKIVTQHDVKPHAWYLDGGRAPVCISIEAGQADLFLCSWLGIDHQVKGHRRYRLLDAMVTFHRHLPRPGETIEYHIEIDRFLKQGEVYLFFFHYTGYINGRRFISMRNGCAGFFTPEEVTRSGGILLTNEETEPVSSSHRFIPPLPVESMHLDPYQVNALRTGDLETAFGSHFQGITLGKGLRLPGGRMHLIDRVLSLDPQGGRYGNGRIVAEADIRPDAWFLTCHFTDDPVMPGTLMYECCAHALRIFVLRMGWVTSRDEVVCENIPGLESDLKCRGPVTPDTQKARYDIHIREMKNEETIMVIADAHMFSDDLRIVYYKNMGLTLAGLTCRDIETFWSNR